MKVLHVSSGNLYGGVEVLLRTLAIERTGAPAMEPHFALCADGRLARELAAEGTPPTFLGPVRTRFMWQTWKARRRLKYLIQRRHFDVVVCHMAWAHAIFGPVVRRAGMPLVFWMHDVATGRHWVERWAGYTTPDFVLCNSQFTASSLPRLFGVTPPFETSTNVVAAPSRRISEAERLETRAKHGAESLDTTVILQVSRLERWKGHTSHLRALALLAHLPGWVCWMTGQPQRPHEVEYLAELRALVVQLGLSKRVRFLGWQEDLEVIFNAADIFCQPNPSPEPFGRVFVEALYARLPVVATAIGGALEIVDDTCGRLVPADAPDRLAATLRNLIDDRLLRHQLGQAGETRARQRYGPAVVLGTIEKTLASRVLSQSTARQNSE